MATLPEFPEQGTFAAQVAANIRAEVARRGLTQGQLAAGLGISQTNVSKRARGKVEWSLNEIETVARLLGTTVSALCAIRDSNPGPAD